MSKKRAEEPKASAPAYIVTFSDMITLLLTFFVMLLSLAKDQVDKHKFMSGMASFRTAVTDFGLSGFLISRSSGPELEHPKPKYRIDEGQDEKQDRSIDSKTEMMRRILMDIEHMMKISPSHISGMDKKFLQTNIRFEPKSSNLDTQNQKYLSQLCQQISVNYVGQEPIIYVLGLAADTTGQEEPWIVSAQRAMIVADQIRSELPKNVKWPVYSWGAGTGGEWVGQEGHVNKQAHILITVLTETR